MREVIISQRTLAHSLTYMQWDPTMPLENLKKSMSSYPYIHYENSYRLTRLANFFPVPKL